MLNLDRGNLGRDEHDIFTFRTKTTKNASPREISLPNRLWNSKKYPKIIISIHFHETLSKHTPFLSSRRRCGTQNRSCWLTFHETLLKHMRDCQKIVEFWSMIGFLGPEVVPDEPGRAAGPAWPAGLAWAPGGLPWLAWLAICLARSG